MERQIGSLASKMDINLARMEERMEAIVRSIRYERDEDFTRAVVQRVPAVQ
jgi:hypothetical protein